jgi:hypothetical protein
MVPAVQPPSIPKGAAMERYNTEAVYAVLTDLANDGGGTYHQRDLTSFKPTAGYAVAIGGVTLPASTTGVDALGWALKAVAGEFMTDLVGTWLDGDTIYIDAVRHIRSLASAFAIGIEAGQKAIYDFAAGESIELPKES